jgi:hypothetical protein
MTYDNPNTTLIRLNRISSQAIPQNMIKQFVLMKKFQKYLHTGFQRFELTLKNTNISYKTYKKVPILINSDH